MSNTLDTSLQIVAGGQSYTGWQSVEITRGIKGCASAFTITAPERFLAVNSPLPLAPFTPIVLRRNGNPLLTGYIFGYEASFSAGQRQARITGRSKTAQLVDCTPDIPAGQYQGYTLQAIAAAVCQIFGLTSDNQTSLSGAALADATLERGETGFKFIDRLATISGVLTFDDEQGRLVLANAGSTHAAGALTEGVAGGIISGRLQNNCDQRFSTYIVKGQMGIVAAAGASGWPSGVARADGADDTSPALVTPPAGQVQTQQRAVANDPGVPLYRPKIIIAEGQLNQQQLQLRVNWQRAYAYGESLSVVVVVPGWTQPDGSFWRVNEMVTVNSPSLGAQEDLLILKTVFRYSGQSGYTTEITVGPVDGAIPDPSLLKTLRKKKGRKGASSIDWTGVQAA